MTSIILGACLGFSVGANVVVARNVGAQKYDRVDKAVHTSIIVGFLFGVVGGLIGIAFARPVLALMGAQGSLLEEAVKYACWYFAGVPFLSLTNFLCAIFRAKGDSKTPLIVLSLAGLINVGLNLMFVLIFKMSADGVAIATSSASGVASIILLIILSKATDGSAFSFKKLKINKRAFSDVVKIGCPAAIQSAFINFSNLLIQSSIVRVNNLLCPPNSEYQPVVNGTSSASNLSGFVYTAQNSVYQAVITFTSQNIGAKKPERVPRVMAWSSLLVILIGGIFGGTIFLCREPLLGLYGITLGAEGSLERIAFESATTQLTFVAFPYFLCGLMEVGSGVLRGLGKSTLAMIIFVIGTCLLRVVWLETVFPSYLNLTSIYVCYPISWIFTSSILFWLSFKEIKKRLKAKG
jgi:putative MATE family efflux protein